MSETAQPLKKLKWQDKVKAANEYHKGMLRADSTWTIYKTSKELGYSESTMAEYLLVAQWIRTHPNIEKYDTFDEALKFVRKRRKEMRVM